MKRLAPVVVVLLALALAACGSSNKLQGKQMTNIEQGIKQKIEQSNTGTHVVSVTCPRARAVPMSRSQ